MRRSILSLYAGFIFIILFTSTNLLYAQWMQTNGLTKYGTDAIQLSLSAMDSGQIFLQGSGVFLSTNNGSSWTAVNSGLPNAYIISCC